MAFTYTENFNKTCNAINISPIHQGQLNYWLLTLKNKYILYHLSSQGLTP